MSNFENIIRESFDDFYINWDPCFDKDIINIGNTLKENKEDRERLHETCENIQN